MMQDRMAQPDGASSPESDGIRAWVRRGLLSPFDQHFARSLARLSPQASEAVRLGAALATRAVRGGHVCAHLGSVRGWLPESAVEPALELPEVSAWLGELRASPLVGAGTAGEAPSPLVLSGDRLYLRRYFDYEQRLARDLSARMAERPEIDPAQVGRILERLFGPRPAGGAPEAQRVAAAVAALQSFSIISGGPGTGKTYTIAKVLALLQELSLSAGRAPLSIRLLAPTGKAAQRMLESLQANLAALASPNAVLEALPKESSTIHRALGYQPRSPTRFRHHRQAPLVADVVVVDEASMVDVALMAKLVDAVPRAARLIFLGDKDQLASVEAGAILGDLYGSALGIESDGYSSPFAAELTTALGASFPVSPTRPERGPQDCRVHLTESRRYAPDSGIARLARAVQAQDPPRALASLSGHDDLLWHEAPGHALTELVTEQFAGLSQGPMEARFVQLNRFRILSAHRRGPMGSEALNRKAEQVLRSAGCVRGDGPLFDGQPIMITENDYELGLFNGDVGIVGPSPSGSSLEVWFWEGQGAMRHLAPASLPAWETVYAMTVHKSQGSEFERVALVLPAVQSGLATRELLYTGITRARRQLDVFATREDLSAAIVRPIARASGLAAAIWTPSPS